MEKFSRLAVSFVLALAFQAILTAQDNPGSTGGTVTQPPKVLVISREFLKPGRAGEVHKKAETAFVQAMSSAKWPTHYLAVTSISGRPRALFFTRYDSFAEWEKDVKAVEKNATLSAALDRAAMTDGDLLSDADGGAFLYREDYSLNAAVDIPHMRYFEIAQFHVKPGHDKEWDEAVKMVLKAYEKMPDMHFACYQVLYGSHDGTYLFFTPLKSAADVDREIAHTKDFESAMGEDGMKRLAELSASAIEWSETNLFAFNPAMSYVSPEWIKADPEYWTPKTTKMAMTHKQPDKAALGQSNPPQ
jgi:hypothetical protein